ncbi:MAG: CsgG/HfaB family protein [Candidatus Erginobacter occultus]|nr:CsgG/HfaB family protein [Candidatus Erginobacter occultus]
MRKLVVVSVVGCLLALGLGIFTAEIFAAPKKTIAVSEFENKSGWSGGWKIGWRMQEMMATSLIDTGRFTVLERQDLSSVMAEQDLGASGRAASGSAAAVGQLARAQILISGAVTEFEEKKGGEGAGIGFKGFRIGGSHEQAHVAINVRIYDTTTGEVLDSLRVAGSADAGGLKIGYSNSDFGGDLGGFRKTPLGEATQEAIDEAVQKIASRLKNVPWQGKIIKASPSQVYINSGSEGGISDGMEFDVYRQGEALIDPDTGLNLGAETEKIGRVKVNDVKEKFAIAEVVSGSDMERGDLVKTD